MATDLALREQLKLLRDGLPGHAQSSQRVLILGAGMAGLVAADRLLQAGHDPLIIEARNRVGGRILTLREPFAAGLYGEAGAMRIPRPHQLTITLCERLGIPLRPLTMSSPNTLCLIRGQRIRRADAIADSDNLGFAVAPHEAGIPVAELWRRTIERIVKRVEAEGQAGWDALEPELDHLSTYAFLQRAGWSAAAIELLGLLFDMEAFMQTNVLEILRQEVGDLYTDVVRVEGGMDRLPHALAAPLQSRIRYGSQVVALDQSASGVTVHVQTTAGRRAYVGDRLIITLPFAALRHEEFIKAPMHQKQQAIRELPYEASVKILLQFRKRFWEADDGIIGGVSVTDLPIRNSYYPEHGQETGRGVVIASYAKEHNARHWSLLSAEQQLGQALDQFAQLHPQAREYYEGGIAKVWHADQYAGGACALFAPGQQLRLFPHLMARDGRFHYAGDHTTLLNGWIEGAVGSGLRAALEIHLAG